MPIYEYECTNCHQHFDLMQKITEEPVTQCPQCLNHTAKRLVSPTAFQLKGTGWYVTDFKDPKKKPSPKNDSSSETTTTSTEDKTKN